MYASLVHVKALNANRTYTPTSTPNLEAVEDFLSETSAVLDGILTARGYALPVSTTATGALELLEHYNAVGAWSMVEMAAPSSPHVDAAVRAWERAQKMLRDGLIEPPGLERDVATSRARAASVPTPFFYRDMTL